MLTEKIIELAQVATSSDINQNLQNTETQLQNLNANLDLLKEEYNAVASQPNNYSFFDLNNIYFWFVLAGLLLLAFGLLFLLAELQNKDRSRKSKVESIKPEEEKEEIIEEPIEEEIEVEVKKPKLEEKKIEIKSEPAKVEAPKPKTAKKPTGPIKIKVEKIK